MSLVKFPKLGQGNGGCWINLNAVDSIETLLGMAHSDSPAQVIANPNRRVPVGCRVAVGVNIFDLDMDADEMAAEVAACGGGTLTDQSHQYGLAAGSH